MEDDIIVVGHNKLGFNLVCECGEKHFHEIVFITVKCPKCSKKKKYKVDELPDFLLYLLKNPAWLSLIAFKKYNPLKIHAVEKNIPKMRELVSLFEEHGCKAKDIGYVPDMNRNTGKKIMVFEIQLRKRIF